MATTLSYNNFNLQFSMYVFMISVLGLIKKKETDKLPAVFSV